MDLFDIDSPINRARLLGLQGANPGLLHAFEQAQPQNLRLPPVAPPPKPLSTMQVLKDRFMPTPSGMMEAGLLTPEDVDSAQNRGLLNVGLSLLSDSGPHTADQAIRPFQSLGRALQSGLGSYQESVNSAMGMRAGAQEYKAKKAGLDQQSKIVAGRQSIIAKYPPPTDNPGAMSTWVDAVLPRFIELGDDDTVKSLTDLRKSLTPKDRYQQTQTGDAATTFDPATGKFFDPKANGGKGGWVSSVERGMNPDELQLKGLQLGEQRARTAAMQQVAQDRALQTQSSAFQSRHKTLIDRASVLKQALVTLRDSQSDPALYTSAVANFIQAADQRAQIRYQLLKYFKDNVDPSIGGRWETLKARMLEGRLPGYVSSSMIKHVGKLLAMSEEEYNRLRSGEVKRHPALEGWLPQSEEIFSEGSFGGNSSSGGGGGVAPRQPGESIEDYMSRTGGQ